MRKKRNLLIRDLSVRAQQHSRSGANTATKTSTALSAQGSPSIGTPSIGSPSISTRYLSRTAEDHPPISNLEMGES